MTATIEDDDSVEWRTRSGRLGGCYHQRCRRSGTLNIVSTPSERIFAQRDDQDEASGPLLAGPPRDRLTLADTAERVIAGTSLRAAVADFVDDLRWARDEADIVARIQQRPPNVDEHTDAYLGALAEHIAATRNLPVPPWASEQERFLDRIWWPDRAGLWARAVVETPAAFRRRGIFRGAGALQRV